MVVTPPSPLSPGQGNRLKKVVGDRFLFESVDNLVEEKRAQGHAPLVFKEVDHVLDLPLETVEREETALLEGKNGVAESEGEGLLAALLTNDILRTLQPFSTDSTEGGKEKVEEGENRSLYRKPFSFFS